MKLKKVLWWLSFVIVISVLVISGKGILDHKQEAQKSQQNIETIKNIYQQSLQEFHENDKNDMTVEEENEIKLPEITLNTIRDINEDFVAWLQVEGTAIDYPVLQTTSNQKYLHRGYFNEYNPYGAIFLDASANIDAGNILIHGHNTFYDSQMFSDLVKFKDINYLKEHSQVLFNEQEWKIIAYFEVNINEEIYTDFPYTCTDFNQTDYATWLKQNLAKANVVLESLPDKVLTLSTCKDYDGNRIVVIAIPQTY